MNVLLAIIWVIAIILLIAYVGISAFRFIKNAINKIKERGNKKKWHS